MAKRSTRPREGRRGDDGTIGKRAADYYDHEGLLATLGLALIQLHRASRMVLRGSEGVMRLKASTEYGMRAVLYLAEKGTVCSSRDVAEDMSIPRDYLIQLAQLLRNAGIIAARPGKHGGYSLAKDPSQISVLDVINALQEDKKRAKRKSAGAGKDDVTNAIISAYYLVERSVEAHMEALTIAMLLDYMHSDESDNEFVARQMLEEVKRLKQGEDTL